MSETVYKTLEEILHAVAEDGAEVTAILELAKAGEEARVRYALEHLERAKALYEQANTEAKEARIHLSKARFDIEILYKLQEPRPDEMLLRVTAARAALLGEDPAGLRRRRVREKSAEETDCHGAGGASQ